MVELAQAKSVAASGQAGHLAHDRAFNSEQHYEAALAGSGVAMWDWDIASDVVSLSTQWQVMLGAAGEPTLTTFSALSALVHADDCIALGRQLSDVLKGARKRYEMDHRVKTPAGDWLWIHSTGAVVGRDSTGRALRMVGANIDITERKRTESALKASEEHFRRVFVQAGVGFHITSLTGQYMQVNEKYCDIIGYSEAELLLMSVRDTQGAADQLESQGFRGSMLSGQTESGYRERQVVRKDKSTLWISVGMTLVRDDAGKPLHFMSVVQDISVRKRMDAELRESREQFEQLADHIPQVFWISDAAHQQTVYISPACERLLGYDAQTLRENPRLLVRGVHPDDRRELRDARQEMIEEGYDQTYRVIKPDGSIRWVHDRAFPVRDARGKIHRYAGIAEDITDRKSSEERLDTLVHYDALTGLPNRTLLHDRLRQSLAQAERVQRQVGVMFIDVDHFKKINDTLGHEFGDLLLQRAARHMSEAVRSDDTVGRLGGDEFAVILNTLSHGEDATRVAQKIMAEFDKPLHIGGTELHITVSIGITLYPDDGADAGTLLKNADIALYSAKNAGRNAFKFYNAEMDARSLELLRIENSLRHALIRNEFELVYQPKASVITGGITGFEALLRWRHPERGIVMPSEFIPLLEDSGLILPVGEWVLETVCAQLQAWSRESDDMADAHVAINISARQFASKDLAQRFQVIVEKYQVDPRRIELEITESALMIDPEAARRTLDYLKALGMKLSIDDFGTGYSSLAYLKRFPLDTLKIDASFVRDVTSDADDANITRTVIAMAHNLRLNVVAEGVETAEQLAFLAEHGCDLYQGYYLSRPLSTSACSDLASRLPRPQLAVV